MITQEKDYYSLYHRIQSENAPSLAILLPTDEKKYSIDLNSRKVEAPDYLGVEKDNGAEVIYFTVNRYFDFFDLSQSICIIQYINGEKESKAYAVPYYDVTTLKDDNLILFPWIISHDVTKKKGIIKFNIRFYKLDEGQCNKQFLYNISTLPASSRVLEGMGILDEDMEEPTYPDAKTLEELLADYQKLKSDYALYWEESN